MIDGVKIKQLKVHPDTYGQGEEIVKKPGILMELLRADEKLLKKFGQTTFTITHQGTIKAFHVHKYQEDLWFVASGKALIALHDMRKKSPTYRQTQTLLAGEGDYKLILIPPGVAHGLKVLSREPVLMFYHTSHSYNPQKPDEKRIAYNDPEINFNWEKY